MRIYNTSKVNDIQEVVGTYLTTGRKYFLDGWMNGGCVVCGDEERDGLGYSHHKCWKDIDHIERAELKVIIANREETR
jgi:hypothetical protein